MSVRTNGFQDRRVMTTSLTLHVYGKSHFSLFYIKKQVPNRPHFTLTAVGVAVDEVYVVVVIGKEIVGALPV